MTGDYKFRFMPGILSLIFTAVLLSGCIAENTDDCFKGVSLQVKLPADVSGETMKDINLYVFDDKDLLLDILPISSSEFVVLDYPGIPVLHCITWCNTGDGAVSAGSLKKGDPLSAGFISLKPSAATRAQMSLFNPPADLFYGELILENTSTSNHMEEQELSVSRMVASMNITIRGLELLGESNRGVYSLVVHETASRLDFEGRYVGDPASYAFTPSFEVGKDCTMPTFNLFPVMGSGGIIIDIYHDGKLLRSVSTDSGNRPLVPVVGKTLNVLLNFKLDVDVQVEITGWGEKYIWKEYN